jgi:hypothetical protein
MVKKPPPKSKRPRDANQLAKMVVDLATVDADERVLLVTQKVQEARTARRKDTSQARRSMKGK